jgi:diguanylate cyclase (GGDEF)-like protein
MALRTDQARLVARYPAESQDAESGIGKAAVSPEYHRAIDQSREEGWYITPTLIDGVERITAYHRLPGYPLTVFTGLGTEAYMAMWRASAWRAWGLAGLCIALIALGSVALYRLQQRERRIRKEQELVINNDLIGMARLRERKIVWTNPAMRRLLKQPAAALQGASTRMLYPDEASYRRIGEKAYSSLLARGKFHAQFQMRNAEGKLLWVDASGTLLNAEESLWILVDIDALKRGEQAANHLANHDALTGLANRRMFDSALEVEWANAVNTRAPLSLIMLDIDYFKQYNDHYGHIRGDECLKQVAQLLSQSATRSRDFFARYGGEEFVLILPECDEKAALQVAQRCRALINEAAIPHAKSQISEHVTISLGVATIVPSPMDQRIAFLEQADRRLYRAKQLGRDCIAVDE